VPEVRYQKSGDRMILAILYPVLWSLPSDI
jgi:hypothetical protein